MIVEFDTILCWHWAHAIVPDELYFTRNFGIVKSRLITSDGIVVVALASASVWNLLKKSDLIEMNLCTKLERYAHV